MKLQIAFIFLILRLAAISARSLEGFTCTDYPIYSSDSFTPTRSVRICGVNKMQPYSGLMQRLYGSDGAWSSQDYQSSASTQLSNSWQSQSPYMLHNLNEVDMSTNDAEVKRPLPEQQLDILTNDVSEVKNILKDITSYIKQIFDAKEKEDRNEQKEENININIKLDPALEGVLKEALRLAENNLVSTTEISAEEVTTENSSEEVTTERLEQSNEENSNEEEHTIEDFNTWLEAHFGPSVNKRSSDEEIEELFNETSEEGNSGAKSEESFETWFYSVYGKVSTETPSVDKSSEENTTDSNESNDSSKSAEFNSNENESNDADKNSKSAESVNYGKDNRLQDFVYIGRDDHIKSSETDKERNTDDNDERNYYETVDYFGKMFNSKKCFNKLVHSSKNINEDELKTLLINCQKTEAFENADTFEKNYESNVKGEENVEGEINDELNENYITASLIIR